MVGFAMSRNGSIFGDHIGDHIGVPGAPVSSSWISGKPGAILNTRTTRGLHSTQLDTVPRITGEVSPLAH